MHFLYWIKLYLLTIPVFFVIDMLWLGFVCALSTKPKSAICSARRSIISFRAVISHRWR
jgi:hypothetical protein